MGIPIIALSLAAIILAGCGLGNKFDELKDKKKKSGKIFVAEMPWIPLGLTRESYIEAEKRLSKYVRVGMPRKDFIQLMKLKPVLGPEWSDRVTAGEGWFAELSRRNKYGNLVVEEFSFGYYKGYRLRERFAVILENGVVRRIARSPWTSEDDPPAPPARIFSRSISIEEEARLIRTYYREKLQSQDAYKKVFPQLKKIRPGWTSAEVRLTLGGSLYQLPNGYVYFQEALLWNDGFVRNDSGPLSIVIMPFGYRDDKGKLHKKVIVRSEGGLVTAVFWQPEMKKKKARGIKLKRLKKILK
ncbi:hypothetical protein ACFLQ0_02480 [Nitrospinota bacterium]